jgi:hypothetical protein
MPSVAPPVAAVGLAIIVPTSITALAVAALRRRRARGWLEARLAARLEGLAAARPEDEAPRMP